MKSWKIDDHNGATPNKESLLANKLKVEEISCKNFIVIIHKNNKFTNNCFMVSTFLLSFINFCFCFDSRRLFFS